MKIMKDLKIQNRKIEIAFMRFMFFMVVIIRK